MPRVAGSEKRKERIFVPSSAMINGGRERGGMTVTGLKNFADEDFHGRLSQAVPLLPL